MAPPSSLCTLEVGDSRFVGFVKKDVHTREEAVLFQQSLKDAFPDAAHVPLCWKLSTSEHWSDEDNEPPDSAGPAMLSAMEEITTPSSPLAVVIVRFFGDKLLGVTCGRLPQCYKRTAALALHRFFHPSNVLHKQDFLDGKESLYGLAAGDTELILDVISDKQKDLVERVEQELEFGGFKGASDEVLPRLQNLQAAIESTGVIPVYRYPGNYHGDEWDTYEWGPTSLIIKEAVETALLPLVEQKMNHCVTNFYRNGDDFIDHHSDKDLDLNQDGVIVSISLGDERIMELRRRAEPKDVTRLLLPHCSMLVLGPKTNQEFTHSILKREGSKLPRLSLTMREVTTFMDNKTGRLFGQGVTSKTVDQVRKVHQLENNIFSFGIVVLSTTVLSKLNSSNSSKTETGLVLAGLIASASLSFQVVRKVIHRKHEELSARDFFSKKSVSGTKY
uniref:Fe2OG dioxygenase domain-containing protein n=1 Tax=Attheya septentrionalis TaxID=420275 RepID=A0A7S2XJP2_9STRA|mmetsp:Transcript_12607/g.22840  ORF Transcript_12607/g.22840 Transcript_12607/m.22840 type:complete len:446 (+) Transcript_12607:81-1418(+)